MKNAMCPKILFEATVVGKRIRDILLRAERGTMACNTNSVIPNVSKDGKIDKLMMHTNDVSHWEHVARNRV